MKRKILGIFLVIMLLAVFCQIQPITSIQTRDKSKIDSFFDVFFGLGNFSMGTKIIIKNIGDKIIQDVEWTFNVSGGIIVFGDGIQGGRLPSSMDPNDEEEINLKPISILNPRSDGQSPIGFGSITMKVIVKGTVGSTLKTGRATRDAFLLGPFILTAQ